MKKILLATDLDRTVIPNGDEPESPQARELFTGFADSPDTIVLYVTGRNKTLIKEAIEEYDLPLPDYAIGDVGSTIYEVGGERKWKSLPAWEEAIAPDWKERSWKEIKEIFDRVEGIKLQDDSPDFQNKFKVSYYTDVKVDRARILSEMKELAKIHGLKIAFIFSVDERKRVGLLDVLPESATKLHAIKFMRELLDIPEERTVFCGDSGNDIPALTSGLNAVMVNNTRPEVIDEVMSAVTKSGIDNKIYTAKGNFLGMNGNYSAGVLEGVCYYVPEAKDLIKTIS